MGILQTLRDADGTLNLFQLVCLGPLPIRWFHDPPDDGPLGMYDGIAQVGAHLFLGQTTSLCETCFGLVPAKIVEEVAASTHSSAAPSTA